YSARPWPSSSRRIEARNWRMTAIGYLLISPALTILGSFANDRRGSQLSCLGGKYLTSPQPILVVLAGDSATRPRRPRRRPPGGRRCPRRRRTRGARGPARPRDQESARTRRFPDLGR